MRLIDADMLEPYKNTIVPKNEITEYYLLGAKDVFKYIDSMPTVDAVQVIRCKDCKYRKQYTHADWSIMLCDRIKTTMADGVKDEDFCSRAERKEE